MIIVVCWAQVFEWTALMEVWVLGWSNFVGSRCVFGAGVT